MIDNIEDARRKLNSFNDVESEEAARWLITQSQREASTAMTASDFQAKNMLSDYLWSRYLKPDIGAAILYQAFPATYSMQVLKEHPNKYLKIAAARMLGGFILFTASASDIQKVAGEVGADDYILKPFESEELLSKIKKFIG